MWIDAIDTVGISQAAQALKHRICMKVTQQSTYRDLYRKNSSFRIEVYQSFLGAII